MLARGTACKTSNSVWQLDKVELVLLLRAAGFRDIELTSAVSPKAIPQLADCQDVLSNVRIQGLMQDTAVHAITLVPNARRLDVV